MSDAEQDALFAASRETFVAERQRLARALKQAGHTKEAADLARIPKPTLAAWVVNQLARQRRSLVKQLGAAGARLRDVQLGMSSGGGGAEARQAFTRAAGEHREALVALRAAAEEILTAAGNSAAPHLLETILRTLRAGGASDIAQATIEQGRLLREIEEQDLGALAAALPGAEAGLVEPPSLVSRGASAPLPADNPDRAPVDVKPASSREEEERARRADESARQAAQQAAARAAEQARARQRDDARREVAERQRAAEKAATEQARYEEEVVRAREILADAERRLAAARAAAETATARLTEAQHRLRALSPDGPRAPSTR